jgi:predicted acetyltransferase
VRLVVPAQEHLASYVAALENGWSPDNLRGRAAAEEQLQRIERDAPAFLASLDDPAAKGAPIELPDGSFAKRLPGITRWIWDGEFCGSIGFRWQPGSPALPATCPGHIGFAVVPWKRGLGYARQALAEILADARARDLPYVEVTTTPDNAASRKVIESCSGKLVDRFVRDVALGGGEALRYRISLARLVQ